MKNIKGLSELTLARWQFVTDNLYSLYNLISLALCLYGVMCCNEMIKHMQYMMCSGETYLAIVILIE